MGSEVRARSNSASAEKTPKTSFPAAVVASTAVPCSVSTWRPTPRQLRHRRWSRGAAPEAIEPPAAIAAEQGPRSIGPIATHTLTSNKGVLAQSPIGLRSRRRGDQLTQDCLQLGGFGLSWIGQVDLAVTPGGVTSGGKWRDSDGAMSHHDAPVSVPVDDPHTGAPVNRG